MIIKPQPDKWIVRIILSSFERNYNYLKTMNLFTETEKLNIENAIKTIKENNRFVF